MATTNSPRAAFQMVMNNVRKALQAPDKVALQIVTQGEAELKAIMQPILSKPGSGKEYTARGSMGKHRASRPGEPPAPDTGKYRSSVVTSSGFVAPRVYYLGVGSTEDRKFDLEYGRTGKRAMAARPHFSVGMQRWITTRYLPNAKRRFAAAQFAISRGQAIVVRSYKGNAAGPIGPVRARSIQDAFRQLYPGF